MQSEKRKVSCLDNLVVHWLNLIFYVANLFNVLTKGGKNALVEVERFH